MDKCHGKRVAQKATNGKGLLANGSISVLLLVFGKQKWTTVDIEAQLQLLSACNETLD